MESLRWRLLTFDVEIPIEQSEKVQAQNTTASWGYLSGIAATARDCEGLPWTATVL